MSFLEFSDHDFLSWIELSGICSVTTLIQIRVVYSITPARHTLHIEDGVRVDYWDYRDYNKARACSDQRRHVLTSPGVENDDEEACEDGQLQAKEDDMLLLVVHDAELLMIRQAENGEQAVEDARCVSMLLFFIPFFDDFIFR